MQNKRILKNIFSISGLQLANYCLPLVTVPYIVRIVGPEKYGTINFAQAFIGYFTLIINYGFDLTATRQISEKRGDISELSKIFWNVIWAKVFLFIFSTVVFLFALFYSTKFQSDLRLYLLTYLINIGIILFPTWFYQGIEELSKTAIFNFVIKIIFTVLIFLTIRQESDYYFYPISLSAGQIVIGFIALVYALKIRGLPFIHSKLQDVARALREGFIVFVSTVVINFYTLSNIVILGFLATDLDVGLFSSAYKFISIIIAITIVPITYTLYPYLGNIFSAGYTDDEKSFKLTQIAMIVGTFSLTVSFGTLLLAPTAITILFGDKFIQAISTLRMLSFLPFIIGMSNVFAIQGMLNLKLDKQFFMITSIGAIVCIVLNFILIPMFHQQGTALAWVITEIFITVATYGSLRKSGYMIFSRNNIKKVIAIYV